MVKGKQQPKAQSTRKQASVTIKQSNATNSPSTASSISSRKPRATESGSVPSCCGCGTVIGEDIKALQCDKCQNDVWKCIDCLDLTTDVYDQLLLLPSCGLKWYCDSCDKAVGNPNTTDKIDKLVSVVEKMVEKFVDIEDKLREKSDLSAVTHLDTRIKTLEENFHRHEKDMELRLATVDGNVVRHVQEKLQEFEEHSLNRNNGTSVVEDAVKVEVIRKMDEEKDIESRQNNIIIYRVPETQSDNLDTRNESDRKFVQDLLKSVFEIEAEDRDIEKQFRLGRFDNSADTARPLLVKFKKLEDKNTVMSNLCSLRRAEERFKGISVAHDLTPKQREERKRMVAEAKQDHESNESEPVENFRFLVVGQGPRKRVIKIRK